MKRKKLTEKKHIANHLVKNQHKQGKRDELN